MRRELLEAARKVELAASLDMIWTHFLAAIEPLGFNFAIYLDASDDQHEDTFVRSNLPNQWPKELLGRPDFTEPFLKHCCATFEISKIGIEFIDDHQAYVDEDTRKYVQTVAEFGWMSAIGIPCKLVGSGRHGGFILGNDLNRFNFERISMPIANEVQSLCLITHKAIDALRYGQGASIKAKPLSAREFQTLDLLSKGMRPKQIAHQLALSEASIRLYLKNARTKLNANTKEQAVAKFLESRN